MPGVEVSHLLRRIDTASSSEIVAAAKMCSIQGLRCHDTLKPLADAASTRMELGAIDGCQLSELAVAFSSLGYFDVDYKKALAHTTVRYLHQLTPHDVSGIAWAFGESQFVDYILMNALLQYVKKKVTQFTPAELSRVLWMFARLRYCDRYITELAPVAVNKLVCQQKKKPSLIPEANPPAVSTASPHPEANFLAASVASPHLDTHLPVTSTASSSKRRRSSDMDLP
eukprot:gene7247-358_t